MDGSTLVIQGKKYTRTNVHQLLEKISGFNCTSKTLKWQVSNTTAASNLFST